MLQIVRQGLVAFFRCGIVDELLVAYRKQSVIST